MNDRDIRFHEIDGLVSDSGHTFNPQTNRFEANQGSDADNNLDHDPDSFVESLDGVSKEEFRDYIAWKKAQADEEYYQEMAEKMIEEQEDDNSK